MSKNNPTQNKPFVGTCTSCLKKITPLIDGKHCEKCHAQILRDLEMLDSLKEEEKTA